MEKTTGSSHFGSKKLESRQARKGNAAQARRTHSYSIENKLVNERGACPGRRFEVRSQIAENYLLSC